MKQFFRETKIKFTKYLNSVFYRTLLFLKIFGIKFTKFHKAYLHLDFDFDYRHVPGATNPNEKKYLYFFTKYFYRYDGLICELGCAFGSLTKAIAHGLEKKDVRIQSFDNFKWHSSWGNVLKGSNFYETLDDGDDFQHIFEYYTKETKSRIDIRSENLENYSWKDKCNIELLVVDVMKNINITNNVTQQFYPHLAENSYLFHQDFCHFFEPWIHLLQFRLKKFFRPVLHIEDSPSVVFQLIKKLPHNLNQAYITLDTITVQEINNAFDYSLSLVDEEPARQNIHASKIYCMFACSYFEEGKQCLKDTLNSYDFVERGNLEYVVKISSSIDEDLEYIQSNLENGVNLLLDLDYITKVNSS